MLHTREHIPSLRCFCWISAAYFYIFYELPHFIGCTKQRKRILVKTTIPNVDNSTEESGNTSRNRFLLKFFVALKTAKTFAIVVAVLTFCILTPTIVGRMLHEFCTVSCRQLWYVVFHYELY